MGLAQKDMLPEHRRQLAVLDAFSSTINKVQSVMRKNNEIIKETQSKEARDRAKESNKKLRSIQNTVAKKALAALESK